MVTFYSHDLIWDEEDDWLMSFEYMYLISSRNPFNISHKRIIDIVKNKRVYFSYDSRCDYFFFGILFRLLVVIYPTLWAIQFKVDDSSDKDAFIKGFGFMKTYRETGGVRRWRGGSAQERFMEHLNFKYIVLNHV